MSHSIRATVALAPLLLSAAGCTPAHTVVHSESGREYWVTGLSGTIVGDGSRVLRVTYLADGIQDHGLVEQAARDLLPHFQPNAEEGDFDAIAFTARHDLIRIGTFYYRAETFTVVYQKQPESGVWVPLEEPS